MSEQRAGYDTGNEQRPRLEIIRQDNLAIILKLTGVPNSATICKEFNPATQTIDPVEVRLWPSDRDMLLRYIAIRQAEQLTTLLTEAVTVARRLDTFIKSRKDFTRITIEDIEGVGRSYEDFRLDEYRDYPYDR